MKILEIEYCDDCPYCEFYDFYEGIGDDVLVCTKMKKEIKDVAVLIPDFCPLKEGKE